jgi:hypothetical protein
MGVLILVLAVSAFAIAALYWRMMVGAVASRPVSERVCHAAGLSGGAGLRDPCAADFAMLERLYAAAGALAGFGRQAALVRGYYLCLRWIESRLPALAPWSQRERTVCSRYLAVRIDGFLASNAACSRRVPFL